MSLGIRIKEMSPKNIPVLKLHRTVLCVLIYSEKVSLTFWFNTLDLFNSQGLSVMSASGSLKGDLVAVFIRDSVGLCLGFLFY